MNRFYCPDLDHPVLDPEQSHHCAHVLRQAVGDLFTVFTGNGMEAKARITKIEKDKVHFQILAKAAFPRPAHALCLAQALTKSKSLDLILQKGTELGVSEFCLLASDHSVSQVEEEKAEAKLEKWQKLSVEAAKQCGQNWLPRVHPPRRVKTFLADLPRGAVKLIASLQPEARPLKTVLRDQFSGLAAGTPFYLMIGPEGDFTPAEMGEARAAGFIPVSLGKIILRAETAAFFALGAIAYELMDRD